MRSWITPAALAGGIVLGAVGATAYGTLDASPQPATAQTSPEPTSPPPSETATAGPVRMITVDGTGIVSGTPDLLTVSMGVQVQAPTATEALRASSDKAASLIATLQRAGVAKADLTTSGLSLWPRYDKDGQQITGYEASNQVTAKLRDLDKAGTVIDAAAAAVGDAIRLNGLGFSIEDTGPLYVQARDLAVAQARTQAEQLAKAAGVALGQVLTIEESAQQVPVPVPYAADAAAAREQSVPIEPGTQDVRLTVRVSFAITS
jgi:uncharacterized protein YggE